MLDVPVYNESGDQIETISVDESLLGGRVRPALLKQAAVMYLANQRIGTAATRSRGMIIGSTRKLFRQKGTGNARMGTIRTPVRRGGGVAFAKKLRDFRQDMPKKMRRLARNNAVLAKILGGDLLLVDQLQYDQPKTKRFATMLRALKADAGCVVAIPRLEPNVYKSGRNIPKTEIRLVEQLNAYEILRRKRLVMTKEGLAMLLSGKNASAEGDGTGQE
jgi:large subunit ribosomal protein L4